MEKTKITWTKRILTLMVAAAVLLISKHFITNLFSSFHAE